MIKIINSGCNGHMGQVVATVVKTDPDAQIVAGIDIDTQQKSGYPVYEKPSQIEEPADVIIDFSNPAALDSLLTYAIKNNIPLILCTTGYSAEQLDSIESASKQIPVFRSSNMSVGINLLVDLIKRACSVLGEDFDIEIVERHHKRKIDAPSGTAILLADAANAALPYDADYTYQRESSRKPREKEEIGISSVRGGTIVGVHDVIFAGHDEVIELRHTAASRDIFALGALRAAKFIAGKSAGLYSMKDMIN